MPRRKRARRQKSQPQLGDSLTFEIKEPGSDLQIIENRRLEKERERERERKRLEKQRDRERQRIEREVLQKRKEEEERFWAHEQQIRADQKRWEETMGKPYIGQTVALLLRPRCLTAVLGTVVEMKEREWETENTSNGISTKGRGRFRLDLHDKSSWGVWMIAISRSKVEFCDYLYEYSHRFCGDYVYFLISGVGFGDEWGTDVYVRHLRTQVKDAEYARLILETYSMGERNAIFFKKRCRKGKSCTDKRVGHTLNEKH